MKGQKISIWDRGTRIPEIYGTLIAIALIAYFFLMYLIGMIHVIELRLVNLVFLIAGVYFALRQYRRTHRGQMDYFHAFTTGIGTAAIGTLTFAVFILIYLHVDKNLMQIIAGGYRYRMARRPDLYGAILSQPHKSEQKVAWMKVTE